MGPNGMHPQELATLDYLWKVMVIGRHVWGLEEGKCHFYSPEGQKRSRELQTGDPLLHPWKGDGNSPGNHFQTMKDKKVIGSRWHGFMKRKSCLTNLIAFYDKMTSSVDEEKAADVIFLDFSKTFNTFSLGDKLIKCGLDSVWNLPELPGSDGCDHWYEVQLEASWCTPRVDTGSSTV